MKKITYKNDIAPGTLLQRRDKLSWIACVIAIHDDSCYMMFAGPSNLSYERLCWMKQIRLIELYEMIDESR